MSKQNSLDNKKSYRQQGFIFAMLGAILFSSKSIVIKFIYEYDVDATTTLGFRLLMAMPFFAAVALVQMNKVRRGELEPLSLKNALKLVVLGFLGYYLASLLDFASLKYISVSLERLILLMTPTFVLLFSVLFLNKKVSKRQLLSLVISYCGVLLVFVQNFSIGGSDILLGSLLVLGSALSYSVYVMGAGELLREIGSTRFVAYAMLVSTFFVLIQLFALHGIDWVAQPLPVYSWSLVHAVVNTFIPTFMLMWSVERIGAPMSTQLGLIGPISLLFLAWIFLDDPITVWDWLGTSIVLASLYMLGRARG
ncbi:MAG: EamA family transporter [Alcaligenaceae bacterium]|jgi:drug/metabolite transporter (DMT)-like permease|nr:EamA family transporter [Alcaligenaceae bacterium]